MGRPTRSHLSLQCDFLLTNDTATAVSILEVVVHEMGEDGALIRRRFVNSNGTAPSILNLRSNRVPAGAFLHLFNPFHYFELDGQAGRWSTLVHTRSTPENATRW